MLDLISVVFLIFTQLIFYFIFVDIIFSWLNIFGINYRPKFIADIVDPFYNIIKSILPTTFGPLDLTPMILIMLIFFIRGLIFTLNPGVQTLLNNYLR